MRENEGHVKKREVKYIQKIMDEEPLFKQYKSRNQASNEKSEKQHININ